MISLFALETGHDGMTVRHRLPTEFVPRSPRAFWCRVCEQFVEPKA